MEFWQHVAFLESDQLVGLARKTEEVGFTGIVTADHQVYPRQLNSPYPYTADGAPMWSPETPWPDSWCLISAMAAVTERLRFTNAVYVAPARSLFTVAKLVATAAVISAGRVSLGVGSGWMKEEFDLNGTDFHTRGRRLDEMIDALRTLWSPGWQQFHGEFYDFDELMASPCPPEPVPVYAGGISDAALRRAVTRCDGWLAEGARPLEELLAWVQRVRKERAETWRAGDPFTILAAVGTPLTPSIVRRLEDSGVTGLMCAPWMTAEVIAGNFRSTLAVKEAAIETFAEQVIARV
ncbi:MAG TPA: TIGR03619 family F420-dependent LLM class oxidoreductase [Acidimicrobiales bacterium]